MAVPDELRLFLLSQATLVIGAAARYVVAWFAARTRKLEGGAS